MGSSSNNNNDWGESFKEGAKRTLCFPVYGAIHDLANGDTAGAAMETVCPIGIASGGKAVRAFASGDTKEGVRNLAGFFVPSGSVPGDPITNFGSELAKTAAGKAYDKIKQSQDEAAAEEMGEEVVQPEEAEQAEIAAIDARDVTNQQSNTARQAAYQAAINSGATTAQAQAIADSSTPIGNAAGNLAALRGAETGTAADYRQKQAYADALAREAKNQEEGKKRAVAGGFLQGGGQGATSGMQLASGLGNNSTGKSVGGGK